MSHEEAEEKAIAEVRAYLANAILIVGFLGAIVFAGLVLVIQSPSFIIDNPNFNAMGEGGSVKAFFQTPITLMEFAVILTGITVVLCLRALFNGFESSVGAEKVKRFIDILIGFTLFLFMAITTFIVIPVLGNLVSVVIMGVEMLVFVVGITLVFRWSKV